MTDETLAFASALFGSVPSGLHTHLWTRQDKRSHWVSLGDGGAAVAERARSLAERENDVYVSVSVAPSAGGSYKRIASQDSAGIMGLWADVDIADPDVHKKFNLPPDEASARDLLDRAGVEPSILVHSGHGLQAWWIFKEFWQFDSDAERRAAGDLAQRWNTTLRVRAAERQWTVDSTFDLARVMRMPGTFNHKKVPPQPVRILHDSGARYVADDFTGFLTDDSVLADMGISPVRSYVVGELALHESANPNFERFEALRENDDLFAASWERRRKDLRDASGSSYDLSLASLAAAAQWDDQEIANLLIAHRRKHRDSPEKALRVDYVRRTIAKARDTAAKDHASEQLDDVVHAFTESKTSGDDEQVRAARRATLDTISQQVGLECVQFIKYTSEPPTYRMVTPTHSIDLGDVNGILGWAKFQASVAAATDHMVQRFKQASWDRVAQAILHATEHQDVGLESTQHGQVYVWLSQFLMARPPVADLGQAAATEYPFVDSAGVHIFGASFRKWLWLSQGEKVSNQQLGKLLRLYGCKPYKLNVEIEGSRTSRSAWTLPANGGTEQP